ncbi:MAG: HEAT repeat domain-containing protein [Planctomycetes bacterium]|nr:HEAT repeat domain-containing protein [Planctomycetota bacterium]
MPTRALVSFAVLAGFLAASGVGCSSAPAPIDVPEEEAVGPDGQKYAPHMPPEIARELDGFRVAWEEAANASDRRKMESAAQKLNAKALEYYEALLNGMIDDNAQVRRVSCSVLGFLRDPQKKPRVAERLTLVVRNDLEHYLVKVAALYSLGHLQAITTDLAPVSRLMNDEMQDPLVRAAGAFAIGRLYPLVGEKDPNRPVFNALVARLADPAPWVRENAVLALQNVRERAAADYLVKYTLHDDSRQVRILTVAALEQIGDDSAVEPLVELLSSDDAEIVVQAMSALERFSSHQGVGPAMVDQLSHADPIVRREAAFLLRYFKGDADATDALEESAANKGEAEEVRQAAIESLQVHRDPQSVPTLIPILDERIERLQTATVSALKAITGLSPEGDKRYQAYYWEQAVKTGRPEVVFAKDYEFHSEKMLSADRRYAGAAATGGTIRPTASTANRGRTGAIQPTRGGTTQQRRTNTGNTGSFGRGGTTGFGGTGRRTR